MRARKAGFVDEMQATGEGANNRLWHGTRVVPTTPGNTIEIGRFEGTSHANTLLVTLATDGTSFSQAKHYIIALQHDVYAGTWRQVSPISVNSYTVPNDLELDIRIENATVYLRLRRTRGTASSNVLVSLQNLNPLTKFDFIPSSATASGATVVGPYPKWHPVTYEAGWTDYGGGLNGVQYRREGSRVYLRGICNCADVWNAYPSVFILPELFRPLTHHIFVTMGNVNTGIRVDVQNTGTVSCYSGGANTGWLAFDNISFPVDS